MTDAVYKKVCVSVCGHYMLFPLCLILLDDYFKDKEALIITKNVHKIIWYLYLPFHTSFNSSCT